MLADAQGAVVHLGERECSIQRRHQKLIEESPSPFVDADLAATHGSGGVPGRDGRGLRQRGHGRVPRGRVTGNFYFLEMNTRLQVEHPVTELVTGRDLVKQQLKIAAGQKLGFTQDDVVSRGWAIECRINAEDPVRGVHPVARPHHQPAAPASGPWVRDDSGVYSGYTIPASTTPSWRSSSSGERDREAAIARMTRALAEYKVVGVQTTIPILEHIMRDEDFVAGRLSTQFLDRMMDADRPEAAGRRRNVALIAAALAAYDRAGRSAPSSSAATASAWRHATRPGWRAR